MKPATRPRDVASSISMHSVVVVTAALLEKTCLRRWVVHGMMTHEKKQKVFFEKTTVTQEAWERIFASTATNLSELTSESRHSQGQLVGDRDFVLWQGCARASEQVCTETMGKANDGSFLMSCKCPSEQVRCNVFCSSLTISPKKHSLTFSLICGTHMECKQSLCNQKDTWKNICEKRQK